MRPGESEQGGSDRRRTSDRVSAGDDVAVHPTHHASSPLLCFPVEQRRPVLPEGELHLGHERLQASEPISGRAVVGRTEGGHHFSVNVPDSGRHLGWGGVEPIDQEVPAVGAEDDQVESRRHRVNAAAGARGGLAGIPAPGPGPSERHLRVRAPQRRSLQAFLADPGDRLEPGEQRGARLFPDSGGASVAGQQGKVEVVGVGDPLQVGGDVFTRLDVDSDGELAGVAHPVTCPCWVTLTVG